MFAVILHVMGLQLRGHLRREPFLLLDDSTVHVRDVEAAVRAVLSPDRTEIGVAAPDKLASGESVVGGAPAVLPFESAHPDEAPDGLASDRVSVPFRHAGGAEHGLAAAGAKTFQHRPE